MHLLYKFIENSKQFFKIASGNQYLKYKCVSLRRNLSTHNKPAVILGIETSCDDTGIAIVDSTGKILGEALNSQLVIHLGEGGINPPHARDLHRENIHSVYEECLKSANMKLSDIDAVAVTVEPGLPLSLIIGRDYAMNLSKTAGIPLIPVHHMKAHALTARMVEKVDFPFLTLLISGGHCLLAIAESIDKFKILGQTSDSAPGEAFDKVARRMKLMNILEYSEISGGEAVELAARKADDPDQFHFPALLWKYRDCNFSFSGLKTTAMKHIINQEEEHNVRGADIIPDANNLCAGFLMALTKHLCRRTQRAMDFIDLLNLIPEGKRTLVVSGGVAANNFIANALSILCSETGFRLVRPPPKLCTDNGVMTAWNGVEKYIANTDVLRDQSDIDKVDIAHRSPIGEDWSKIVTNQDIKRQWVKLKFDEIIGQ